MTVQGAWTAGASLSDPDLLRGGVRGRRFAFRPGRGVLGFAEADIGVAKGWTLGVGAYADTADFVTFAGRTVRGNQGWFATLDGALIPGAEESDPPKLEAFVVLQDAPRDDRSQQPFFAAGGLVLTGPFKRRLGDVLAVVVQSGHVSRQAGGGTETTFEANYRFTVNGHWGLRPDVQYVHGPGGRRTDAWVAGMQIEFGL